MTPRIRRPKNNKVKEGEPQDSQPSADYRFWISFQGSHAGELADVPGPAGGDSKKRTTGQGSN